MTNQTPLVSVIIVNWNGKKWLKKCLDSLQVQTYPNLEIVVVDNASSDDSCAYIEENYPKVVLVKSDKNRGFAGGNNLGIKESKGELILLLNSDTWVERQFVSGLVECLNSNDFDVVAPREARYAEGSRALVVVPSIDPFGHPSSLRADKTPFYLSGVSLLVKKDLYLSTGGLDENFFMYCEEVDWFWRLALQNKKIAYADSIKVHHAGAGSTGSGLKKSVFLWRNENTLQMLLKNYKIWNLSWVLPLYFLQNIGEIIVLYALLKPQLANTYLTGWIFNLKHIRRTWSQRKQAQAGRTVGDLKILGRMYLGFGKLQHLGKALRRAEY